VALTTDSHLEQGLKKERAIPLLPIRVFRACSRVNCMFFTFTFFLFVRESLLEILIYFS